MVTPTRPESIIVDPNFEQLPRAKLLLYRLGQSSGEMQMPQEHSVFESRGENQHKTLKYIIFIVARWLPPLRIFNRPSQASLSPKSQVAAGLSSGSANQLLHYELWQVPSAFVYFVNNY
jgi:hypothetical protein